MRKSDWLKAQLIGKNVKVIGRKIQGKIIEETKNMFTIDQKDNIKKIIKNKNKFEFTQETKKIQIDGEELIGKPEERIKKVQ